MDEVLRVESLKASVGRFILDGIDLSVGRGEVFVLLGPSGAGKTVLLETVAGFHKVRMGRIFVGGVDVTRSAPRRRKVALVFQDYALFPHMSVKDNILFGTRYHPERHDERRFKRLVGMLDIEDLLERSPSGLSGGEAQRVSLARALLVAPDVLLADEPFGALDAPMRERLRIEFIRTVREMGQAVLFVTHDRNEAHSMADRIGVMRDGRILQVGRPDDLFYAPASVEIAEFVGAETILEGSVKGSEDGLVEVDVGGVSITALGERSVGSKVTLCIRADRVAIMLPEDVRKNSMRNMFYGVVRRVRLECPVAYVEVDCGFRLTAAVTRLSLEELGVEEGRRVCVAFKAVAVHIF